LPIFRNDDDIHGNLSVERSVELTNIFVVAHHFARQISEHPEETDDPAGAFHDGTRAGKDFAV
jgi:hypothetical protein